MIVPHATGRPSRRAGPHIAAARRVVLVVVLGLVLAVDNVHAELLQPVGDSMSEDTRYQVVINDEEQYSIWPDGRELPLGWRSAGMAGSKQECLAHIETVWTDMRPLSLRRAMDGTGS